MFNLQQLLYIVCIVHPVVVTTLDCSVHMYVYMYTTSTQCSLRGLLDACSGDVEN